MKMTVIAPCFNEEGNVASLVNRIDLTLRKIDIDYEIILVDDGSTDETWNKILEMAKKYAVKGIKNAENSGIFNSWLNALQATSGDLVCLIDSDLQNPPEAILNLFEKYKLEKPHLVQGFRSSIDWDKDSRYYSSRILNYLLNTLFSDSARDNKSGFVLGPKKILEDILSFKKKYRFPHTFIRVSARSKGYLISETETLFQLRKSGKSYLNSKNILKTYFFVIFDCLKALSEFGRGNKHPIRAILNKYEQPVKPDFGYKGRKNFSMNLYFNTMPLHAWNITKESKNTFGILKKTQWMESNEIEKIQNWRLERLIWHVYTFVPYYQRLFNENGIHPKDISNISDLSKIPLLEKSDVSQNLYMDLFSTEHNKKEMLKISTSGSTGQPFVTYADRQQLEIRFATTLRSLEWTGWQFGDRQVRLWHQKIGMSQTQVIREKIDAKLLKRKFIPAFELSEESLKRLVDTLNNYRPQLIDGYAESLNFLAMYFKQGGKLNFKPKGLMSSAQMLTTGTRKQIEDALGARLFDKYGSREFSGIAYQCEKSFDHHVMDESYIVEILKNGKKALPGEIGEVVITDLNNFSVPLIRYRIGDLAMAVDQKSICDCGRGLSRIGDIQGRTQALIHCANERWLPGTFFAHFFKDYEHMVKFFQVIQEIKGEFTLLIVKGEHWTSSEWNSLLNNLRTYTGETNIKVEYVSEIPLLATGKRTPVISKVKVDFQLI
jgi:phenylacetate-CoA ligase